MNNKPCKNCGGSVERGPSANNKIFCSAACRNESSYNNGKDKLRWTKANTKTALLRAEFSPGKKKCMMCGGWYVQVGTHIVLIHGLTAKEYRIQFDLPLKRGITGAAYRKRKADKAIANGTINNLKKGKKMRYKKKDPRAATLTGWKGRKGSKGYTATDYYE